MNDVKTILNLLKDGAFSTGGSSSSEEVTQEFLLSLSNYLGHGVYPIKEIRASFHDGSQATYSPFDIQDLNLKSSAYLMSDKFMTILIPNDSDLRFRNLSISILDVNETVLVGSLRSTYFIEYDSAYYDDNDNQFICFQLSIPNDVRPQEIIIEFNSAVE